MDIIQIKQLLLAGEKVNVEYKEAKNSMPKSVYESYSAFANTEGGTIILGVEEDKSAKLPNNRFIIRGVQNPTKVIEDFWRTINSMKVNVNILVDRNVYIINDDDKELIVIEIPRADFKIRPVYINENPLKGTFKRNNEGDYHCSEDEVKAMIRDQNPEGNDGTVLEYYTMDDIDMSTLRNYRKLFQVRNPEHIWNSESDQNFLEYLGGYRKDRRKGIEGLTIAGLMMFGKGVAIRDEFDNIFMDYRDESMLILEERWNDRVTYDGTWENNLFNFFTKITPKLTENLRKPFVLEGMQRIDDTPIHKAIREAFVNMIIHADYLMEGTLKVIKLKDGFSFTNPGILKLPKEEIYKGGNSKPRNPRMQTMLRLAGFGDNAGSGFPSIIAACAAEDWYVPKLEENTILNQVTLTLRAKEDFVEFYNSIYETKQLSGRIHRNTTQSDKKTTQTKENTTQTVENPTQLTTQTVKNTTQLEENTTQSNTTGKQLKDKDKMILEVIEQMPEASQSVIAEKLHWDVNTVKYYTNKLKKNGYLKRNGNLRKGQWIVER